MTQKPGLIDQTLVHGDLLFTTSKYRCRYIGLSARDQLLWRQNNVGKWQRIDDVQEEAAPLAPPVESETNVGAAPAGPNGQTSSRDVQKDRADEDHVALVDPLPGDRSPPYQPTSLPTPVKANVPDGPTKAELLPPAVAAMRESVGSQTETTPLGATGRKRGRSGGCQLTKQKPLGGSSKAGPKLSPERMRRVLDSLAEYPIKGHAAAKAGIFRKTLDYWLKGSAAGQDQYDVEWRGETWKFHEHFEAAMAEADDNLFAAMLDIAMGGVTYKTDKLRLDLGYQGPDAYLRDENGIPVVETIGKMDPKVLLRVLEWKRPDTWGKHPKIDVPHQCGVLVVGDTTKKLNCSAASIEARKRKSRSRMLRNAKT